MRDPSLRLGGLDPRALKLGLHVALLLGMPICQITGPQKNVYDHPVEDLCLAISLGMENCGIGELGVQHRPEDELECTEEPTVSI